MREPGDRALQDGGEPPVLVLPQPHPGEECVGDLWPTEHALLDGIDGVGHEANLSHVPGADP